MCYHYTTGICRVVLPDPPGPHFLLPGGMNRYSTYLITCLEGCVIVRVGLLQNSDCTEPEFNPETGVAVLIGVLSNGLPSAVDPNLIALANVLNDRYAVPCGYILIPRSSGLNEISGVPILVPFVDRNWQFLYTALTLLIVSRVSGAGCRVPHEGEVGANVVVWVNAGHSCSFSSWIIPSETASARVFSASASNSIVAGSFSTPGRSPFSKCTTCSSDLAIRLRLFSVSLLTLPPSVGANRP